MPVLVESTVRLGPAQVTDVKEDRVLLEMPDRKAWARLAVAYPYQAVPGDLVLAIGNEDLYVIGVLHGSGQTRFCAPGDLELSASGRILLRSQTAIELRSPEVRLRAERLELVAKTLVEKMVGCYRWVKDTIQVRSGRMRIIVDGHHSVAAERIIEHATKDVKINGRKILLG
jgi:hypothetical protein